MHYIKTPLFLILLIVITSLGYANEQNFLGAYFLNKNTDNFVTQFKQSCQNGKIPEQALIFFSEVLKQNPNKIDTWTPQIMKGDFKCSRGYMKALILSNTKQAKDLMSKLGQHSIPNIDIKNLVLKAPLNTPQIMDNLWAYYFATRDKDALYRLTKIFNYEKYTKYVALYKSSKKTNEDKQKAIYGIMFQTALWSIDVNAKKYITIQYDLENILNNYKLTDIEKRWIFYTLHKVNPKKFKFNIIKDNNEIFNITKN